MNNIIYKKTKLKSLLWEFKATLFSLVNFVANLCSAKVSPITIKWIANQLKQVSTTRGNNKINQ